MNKYQCEICSSEFTEQNSLTLFGINICNSCMDEPNTKEYVSNRGSKIGLLMASEAQKTFKVTVPFPAKLCSGLATLALLSGAFAILIFIFSLSTETVFFGYIGAIWWLTSSFIAYVTFSSIALALIYLKRITHALEKS